MNFKKKKNNNSGFSLIELMVAVTLFSIVVVISMGAIFTIVDSNKKAQSLKSVMNNLNFAFESMTRSIKTAKSISSPDDSCASSISFTDVDDNSVQYSRDTSGSSGKIKKNSSSITASEVNIENLKFCVQGKDLNDGEQARVLVQVSGSVESNSRVSSDFELQTVVSLRKIDN